jgi:receptor protein-tyrosine kinase
MNAVTRILTSNDTPVGAARSIGDILVATGRLSAHDAAKIAAQQEKNKSQFGDAAIALKLLTKEDIDFALSQQYEYSYLTDKDTSLSPELVAAYQPFSQVGENLRAVRSQLMLRWLNGRPSRKAIAIVSPGKAEGRSFIAANLAVVFSQQGQRTLLIDGDLRAMPKNSQQALFRLEKNAGLSGMLAGRIGLDFSLQVAGLPGLSVLTAGAVPPNPQELLGRAAFDEILLGASQRFDVIIIDTPTAGLYSDAEIIASRAQAALVVTRKGKSVLPSALTLAQRLQSNGVTVVGSVLNDD